MSPAGKATSLAPPFLWGAATSAYQIEGGTREGGRGPSIWDTFAAVPGRIEDGSTGERACDHYHRWREDLGHLGALGVDAYRFSIAWPRVVPTAAGTVNEAGLAFYDRLVDGLLDAGVRPFATLYHWDLPEWLEERGGWPARETVDAFVDYAEIVARRLGDRVKDWLTHNEPWCVAMLGHLHGAHAPGRRDGSAALAAAHHVLLSHGRSIPALRAAHSDARVGLAHLYVHCEPASESELDAGASRELDGTFNRWYLDPLHGRGYPPDILEHYERLGYVDASAPAFVRAGDLEEIACPTDFLGVNYYSRAIARGPEAGNLPRRLAEAPAEARTDMGWEIFPDGLAAALTRLHQDYAPGALYVTENGIAYGAGGPDPWGRVPDGKRIDYLDAHLARVATVRAAGVPVHGYFVWSLLDNFEWAYGHSKRFGLLHVDFETQARTFKDSAHWYKERIAMAKRGARA